MRSSSPPRTVALPGKSRPGTTDNFHSVAFANAKDGWAVGDESIIATTNGGATWKKQYSTTGNESFNCVACANATHAWAVGQGFIVATTNGGATWKVQYSGWLKSYSLINDIEAIACANASDAWRWVRVLAVAASSWRPRTAVPPGRCSMQARLGSLCQL